PFPPRSGRPVEPNWPTPASAESVVQACQNHSSSILDALALTCGVVLGERRSSKLAVCCNDEPFPCRSHRQRLLRTVVSHRRRGLADATSPFRQCAGVVARVPADPAAWPATVVRRV